MHCWSVLRPHRVHNERVMMRTTLVLCPYSASQKRAEGWVSDLFQSLIEEKHAELASCQQNSLLEKRRAPVRPPIRALQLDNPLYTWCPQSPFKGCCLKWPQGTRKNLSGISLSRLSKSRSTKQGEICTMTEKVFWGCTCRRSTWPLPHCTPFCKQSARDQLRSTLAWNRTRSTRKMWDQLFNQIETYTRREIQFLTDANHTVLFVVFGRGWQYRLNGPQHSTTEYRKVIGQF